jgi:hypothetical protein
MLIIEANYSKKIGLPGYSSHQYSLTLRSEISDINQVPQESQRLYALIPPRKPVQPNLPNDCHPRIKSGQHGSNAADRLS